MSTESSDIPEGEAGRLIRHYKMEKIPHEGGWFALRWVSRERVEVGGRAAGSAILALMTRRDFSAMHRLRTDETWHFHGGEAAELLLLHPAGRAERRRLGADVWAGEEPQITVPAGTWMGARPAGPAGTAEAGAEAYSFFGCTLAPGFDPADYEPGWREELAAGWPEEAGLIAELTREDSLARPAGKRAAEAADGAGGVAGRVFATEEAAAIDLGGGARVRELVGRAGAARTEAVSVARFRLEAGATTGSSRYLGCDEFFVVLAGEGVATLEGAETPVRAGSVVAIPRGAPHALRAGAGGPLEFLAVLAPAFDPACFAPER